MLVDGMQFDRVFTLIYLILSLKLNITVKQIAAIRCHHYLYPRTKKSSKLWSSKQFLTTLLQTSASSFLNYMHWQRCLTVEAPCNFSSKWIIRGFLKLLLFKAVLAFGDRRQKAMLRTIVYIADVKSTSRLLIWTDYRICLSFRNATLEFIVYRIEV